MTETPLVGGNISDAVRVGDTVRRRAGPHTPAVHALLRHLEAAAFPAPRALGMDERGREVLSYIEGDTEPGWPEPAPDWVFSLDALTASAALLRRFHDDLLTAYGCEVARSGANTARGHLPQRLVACEHRVPRPTPLRRARLGWRRPG